MCKNKVPCSDPAGSGLVIYRPCGKCLDCLRQYQQDWTIRLDEESKAWAPESVIFFTLTYADENLPYLISHVLCDGSVEQTIHRGSVPKSAFLYTRDVYHDSPQFRKERKFFCDSFLDFPADSRPPICVPTALYDDVNQWIRYCRKYFARHVTSAEYKGREVSPYLRSLSWQGKEGRENDFPSCAYTPSFKYWITSEYGPGTLRPHYHGVLFGVPEEMFCQVFAPWWIEHFGSEKYSKRACKWSVYDPNKGGSLYIAKYCSKGSYDHPLQSKVIRYKSGKEFISRSYINCLNWFGVDCPLVVPTFHLISKGIGVRYAFNASVQSYWYSECIPEGRSCVCRDLHRQSVPLSFLAKIPTLKSLRFSENNPFGDLDMLLPVGLRLANSVCSLLRCDCRTSKVFGESEFLLTKDEVAFHLTQDIFLNKKHVRKYVYKGQNRTYVSILPRYYRRFLLSPLASLEMQDAFLRRSESDFALKRQQVRRARCQDEKEALASAFVSGQMALANLCAKDLQDRCFRFYGHQFKGDFL